MLRTTLPLPEVLAASNQAEPRFRIDSFAVPEAARAEFEQAMRRNWAFIEKLPGFLGHVVFEQTGGPAEFNVMTFAAWRDAEALERAAEEVRAYYRRIGFDPPAALARWGARAEIGSYRRASEHDQT